METLTLKQLSRADIDAILQSKPFELDRELRKQVVGIAKGNPRIAAIAAEALKRGENVSEESPALFKVYFDSVFSELRQHLDSRPQYKRLLALIADRKSVV